MPWRVSYFIRRQIKFSGSVSEWERFSRRDDEQHGSWPALVRVTQAYTSQFVALIMFALMMSEDRLSLQKRRLEIIDGLRILPGQSGQISRKHEALLCSRSVARSLSNNFFFFYNNLHNFNLSTRPELIKQVLALDEKIKAIANELYQQRSLLVMGRGFHYATCLEGALVSSNGGKEMQILGWATALDMQ